MQSPNLAIKEMERCVNELGLVGVEIGTHINVWNLNAPELFHLLSGGRDIGCSNFCASLGYDGL